ncbi:A24 family peptidase [Roseovarius sp. D22-M7]|uniref:A24 family peptidase n=1 Tax=Roseovarius sp. D22-M7 TaxID=3127116 RepID=UPI00300FA608
MQDSLLILAPAWFIAGQGIAAANDAVRMRIPNALILYLLAGAALAATLSPPGWLDLAARTAVGLAILGGGLALFARGWMGGGDVKLLAVTALWLGPAATPGLLILTALGGGVLTLALVAARSLGAGRLAGHRIAALRDPMDRVPYGIAIAAAAIAAALLRPEALSMG